jgi:hypothetical protein
MRSCSALLRDHETVEASVQALKFNLCASEAVVRAVARFLEQVSELNGQALPVALDREHSAIVTQARSSGELTTVQIDPPGKLFAQKLIRFF